MNDKKSLIKSIRTIGKDILGVDVTEDGINRCFKMLEEGGYINSEIEYEKIKEFFKN